MLSCHMSSSQCEASVKVMELKFCPPADACTLSEVCLRLLSGHFAFCGLAPDKWRDSVISLVLNRYQLDCGNNIFYHLLGKSTTF